MIPSPHWLQKGAGGPKGFSAHLQNTPDRTRDERETEFGFHPCPHGSATLWPQQCQDALKVPVLVQFLVSERLFFFFLP